jgi:predicted Fe-Mo cluster-binding NifX family protein
MITSQTTAILNYLKTNGTITSMEAINRFGATRLSAIILKLRQNHNIDMIMQESKTKNQYGHISRYGLYIYKGEKV